MIQQALDVRERVRDDTAEIHAWEKDEWEDGHLRAVGAARMLHVISHIRTWAFVLQCFNFLSWAFDNEQL